jgi:hypothetical protein
MATKTLEQMNPASCLNRAEIDEPIFVLRSSDETAPGVVREWASRYFDAKGGLDKMTNRQRAKYYEALALAEEMHGYRLANHCSPEEAARQITEWTRRASAPPGGIVRYWNGIPSGTADATWDAIKRFAETSRPLSEMRLSIEGARAIVMERYGVTGFAK